MISLNRWLVLAVIPLSGGVTPLVVAQDANLAPASDCRDEQGLTYICGLVVPEDILTMGSTGFLLVSGHRAPGHLYLIDPVTRTTSELIHSAAFASQLDTRAYPDCPGPLNLEAFILILKIIACGTLLYVILSMCLGFLQNITHNIILH